LKRCILSDCVNLEAIDRLTIQRDAAEALARETQTALVKVAAVAIINARCVDEMQAAAHEAMSEAYDNGMSDGHPLAELRPKGIVGVKADFDAIANRARKLVGGME
jgi:hypothetical protein